MARTHVELLERRAENSVELSDALADISGAIRNLQHLIVQLISLAKAEQPSANDESSERFDLVACAAATARNQATVALARNLDLSFETECDGLFVAGNAIYAGEMIANLLDNAIGYGVAMSPSEFSAAVC